MLMFSLQAVCAVGIPIACAIALMDIDKSHDNSSLMAEVIVIIETVITDQLLSLGSVLSRESNE